MPHPSNDRDIASTSHLIVEILGSELAEAFFLAFRGKILYVPKRVILDHPLVTILGLERAKLFQKEFGGQQLLIPLQSASERAERNKQIWKEREEGASLQVLAQKFNLSVRHVCKILKDIKGNENIFTQYTA